MTAASGRSTARVALGVGVLGIVAWLIGLALDPRQALVSYLVAYATVLTTALGALTLVMIGHVMTARWIVALRRLAEHVAATLPLLAVLVLPLLLGVRALYPWAAPARLADPRARALVEAKHAYLDVPFFVARALVYFATWIVLAALLRRWSLRQDSVHDAALSRRQRALSAGGLPALALTLTFASFDWLMSLSPTWYSTVYGVDVFAGGFVACLALLAVVAYGTLRAGALDDAWAESHVASLGTLLLTFVIFWAYIGYSQYLIVWIGDLPLEIGWYVTRTRGSWGVLALGLVAGHFALPFFLLLWRSFKRRPAAMAALGGWLLAMHWLDVYWLVMPELHPAGVRPHWLDLAALAAVGGGTACFAVWRARGHALVPRGDPAPEEPRGAPAQRSALSAARPA